MRVEATARFQSWINALKDRSGRARILVRIDRLAHGNPGQHRLLAGGVSELKIDAGPGYRVYYTRSGSDLIILLGGGDKSSQKRDITAALALARSLKE
jgi:putative addiction module killer protein